ncbi:ABC transporter substrate-binding protein [Tsukamurella asaccharolytica]|uniref:ABC transporter substrate-binding protein n=1 Tax=Tsukamurella asaccharolytica TaxID=2592067 RepID=A0A5C5R5R6_9ACTN|nr:substrate-binding domain-containing protein [Tsukamurella asaccharolytica]TWS18360.1 ABC transporter substrate-binding protein [Tsukamurella asaccharolytica]
MGSHRSATGSRGIARWLIVAVAAVVVVAAVAGAMVWLSGRSAQEGRDAAASCVRGDLAVQVAAAPALVEPLRRVAEGFNASGTVSADYCAKIQVTGIDSRVALDALAGAWDPKLGAAPSLWIPESTVWTARLAAVKPAELSGQPTSIATSPVVLAVRGSARPAFDGVRWLDLPARQEQLRIALPTGAEADGTYLAAQSVGAAVARTSGAALSDDAARSPVVTGALARWAKDAPASATTGAALDALTTPGDAVRAVPVLEQQLATFARGRGAAAPVAVYPAGPTASATYPAAVLDRGDTTDAHHRAAADFVAYLTRQGNAKPLAEAGFRVTGEPAPAKTDSVAFGTVEPLAPAGNATVISLADSLNRR